MTKNTNVVKQYKEVKAMPKPYSEKEREYIIKRLKDEAKDCLLLYGVKKTTVDEIVKRVNIPKGTFYLFYDSKELLLFDAINDIHNEIQTQLYNEVVSITEHITCEKLTDCLYGIYKKVDETCLLRIMTSGELELIMRKLPNEIIKKHLSHDNVSMEQIMKSIPQAKGKNIECFSGAFRGIFLTMLHKNEIGEKIFDDVLRIMINGVVIQLMGE